MNSFVTYHFLQILQFCTKLRFKVDHGTYTPLLWQNILVKNDQNIGKLACLKTTTKSMILMATFNLSNEHVTLS